MPQAELAAETIQETPFYIPATGLGSRPRSSLKHNDTLKSRSTIWDSMAQTAAPLEAQRGRRRRRVLTLQGDTYRGTWGTGDSVTNGGTSEVKKER